MLFPPHHTLGEQSNCSYTQYKADSQQSCLLSWHPPGGMHLLKWYCSAALRISIIFIWKLSTKQTTHFSASKLQDVSVFGGMFFDFFGSSQKPLGTRGKWDEKMQLELESEWRCHFTVMGLRSSRDWSKGVPQDLWAAVPHQDKCQAFQCDQVRVLAHR